MPGNRYTNDLQPLISICLDLDAVRPVTANMFINKQTRSNLLILTTILSASSLASASSAAPAVDVLPGHHPTLPDLPPWSLSLPAGRLDYNLHEIPYSEKLVPVQTHPDVGSETAEDDSHAAFSIVGSSQSVIAVSRS